MAPLRLKIIAMSLAWGSPWLPSRMHHFSSAKCHKSVLSRLSPAAHALLRAHTAFLPGLLGVSHLSSVLWFLSTPICFPHCYQINLLEVQLYCATLLLKAFKSSHLSTEESSGSLGW